MRFDPYETLGVDRKATREQIKSAFRKLAMECHPDRGGNVERFHEVNEAHKLLSNEESRRDYDLNGFAAIDPKSPFEIALKTLMDLFNQAIEQSIDMMDVDIVLGIERTIELTVKTSHDLIFKSEQRIKSLNRLKKKIKVEDRSPLYRVFNVIDRRVRAEEDNIENMKTQEIIFDEARKILRGIQYKKDFDPWDLLDNLSGERFFRMRATGGTGNAGTTD